MRAPKRHSPPLGTLLALFVATITTAATTPFHQQTYIVCKGPSSHICLAWPLSSGRLIIDRMALRCGLASGPLTFHRLQTVKLSELNGATKGSMELNCVVVMVDGKAGQRGRGQRARRQVGRGRYRGQTQSQYLAIERGSTDDGKAEAHSAPESSRASVSGNSGMGQAQSQSMYDPTCDDCYGRNVPGAASLKQDQFTPNGRSGYAPGQSWSYPGSRDTPTGTKHNGESSVYGPLPPGQQGYHYYGIPGSNGITPSDVTAIGLEQKNHFSPDQSGILHGTGPGQGDFRGTYRPDPLANSGTLRPVQGPLGAGYSPGQRGYGSFQPNPPATLVEPDNSLRNRYNPLQNNGIRNYQGSYPPGSLVNTPIRGPGRLGGIDTGVDTQPNQMDLPGRYNALKPSDNSYRGSENTRPGKYNPDQNIVFTPPSDRSFSSQTPGSIMPGSPNTYTGMYNQNQPGSSIGLGSNAPRGDANQGTPPGSSYSPNQGASNNLLGQPTGGHWPMVNYRPGSSPYFCCVVGPDGNIIPADAAPYGKDNGATNQYSTNNNKEGYGGPMYSSGSNGKPNGNGYVPNHNFLVPQQQQQQPNVIASPNGLFNSNQGPREGLPNQNGYYSPPANMGLLPHAETNYRPGIGISPGSVNNFNQNAGGNKGRFPQPPSVSNNDILYKPNSDAESDKNPPHSTNGGYAPTDGIGYGHFLPDQSNSGNVGSVAPGYMRPQDIGSGNIAIQGVMPHTGGIYGPGPNIGNGYQSNNPVDIPYPDQRGSIGSTYLPQQNGGSGPDGKKKFGPNSNTGPGSNLSFDAKQNPARDGSNYLPVPGAGYTPNTGGTMFESGSNAKPEGNNFGTTSDPGNYQRFGPGQSIGADTPRTGQGQNVYPNGLYVSGMSSPSQNNRGNVGIYNPEQGLGENGGYGPNKDGMLVQPGNYAPGIGGQQSIYPPDLTNKYGVGSVGNGYDQRFVGPNREYSGVAQNFTDLNTSIADGDDSEAEASVSQAANGTTASASSRGGNDRGRAQTNVHGTYTGSGSFSAQAQITGESKEAQSEVSGSKKGASSSAQGSGRNNKSQANVQLGSETGSVQTQSLTNGAYHSSNSQVQGSIKGGMADAQARGPGSTSSQAQIGFTPYKDGDKAHEAQKIPFVGGGIASAQSSGRTGQSQSQLHGTFKYGITYNGAAQSGGSVDKDAVFPNRLPFDKIDVFDENEKNINVDAEKAVTSMTEPSTTTETETYVNTISSEEPLPSADNIPKLGNMMPVESDDRNDKVEESLKDSESRYSSHTHLDHHKVTDQPPPAAPSEGTRNFPSNYGNNGGDEEYTMDREDTQTDEYDTEGADVEQGEYSNYDEIPRDPVTHQSLQSPRKQIDVKQTTGGNTQHIVLGSLENQDAEITQRNSERPDETKTYLPGERVPGTGGYTIPAGFTGVVKSVASKEKTYVVGSKESPSQAQTVTLTPGGSGKVRYMQMGGGKMRPVGAGKLRSLQAVRPRTDRYVTVSKSVARDLDAEDHVRKQYSHSYYTKSSSCGFFTFTCTMVSGAEGSKKVCKPKVPTNPDGTPIRC